MPDRTQPNERFKAPMPQIPGVNVPAARGGVLAKMSPAARLALGLFAVLVVVGVGARWLLRSSRSADNSAAEPPAQIEVPPPASDVAKRAPPVATETAGGIATLEELAKTWSSKAFFFRDRLTGENVPSLIIRLPGGPATSAASYWAFSLRAPFGRCELEYITEIDKLTNDYGFRARHPMVGDPCSRTVFDPLRMFSLPGGIWVRGAVAQGSAIRPPLGVELRIHGNELIAARME